MTPERQNWWNSLSQEEKRVRQDIPLSNIAKQVLIVLRDILGLRNAAYDTTRSRLELCAGR